MLPLGSARSLGRAGGSHGELEEAADVDQRPCVGLGGNRGVGPWACDLLESLSCVLGWAGLGS